MLLMQGEYGRKKILLAAVCDGMGGLAKGEAASGAMVKALAGWFENDLQELLADGIFKEKLFASFRGLFCRTDRRIAAYGQAARISLGTTAAVIIIVRDRFFLANVGDSRIYCLHKGIRLLTKDQTFVQNEVDAGRMTEEEAARDPRQNILTQCIGAGTDVVPAFSGGKAEEGTLFLLCSDGFRHVITPEEIYSRLTPQKMRTQQMLQRNLGDLVLLNLERNEDDNISALAVKICSGSEQYLTENIRS